MYWTSETDHAWQAFAREFGAMSLRDVLSEDRGAVEACQRGLSSGAIDKVNFQDHEMLLRHLYEEVVARVSDYIEERKQMGVEA
jgi:hypothetical protein